MLFTLVIVISESGDQTYAKTFRDRNKENSCPKGSTTLANCPGTYEDVVGALSVKSQNKSAKKSIKQSGRCR